MIMTHFTHSHQISPTTELLFCWKRPHWLVIKTTATLSSDPNTFRKYRGAVFVFAGPSILFQWSPYWTPKARESTEGPFEGWACPVRAFSPNDNYFLLEDTVDFQSVQRHQSENWVLVNDWGLSVVGGFLIGDLGGAVELWLKVFVQIHF